MRQDRNVSLRNVTSITVIHDRHSFVCRKEDEILRFLNDDVFAEERKFVYVELAESA